MLNFVGIIYSLFVYYIYDIYYNVNVKTEYVNT